MERTAYRASPKPDTEVFDLLVAVPTASAILTGWEESIDNDEFFPIPVGLVGKLSADFSPCCICNMKCELMVLYHIRSSEILHTDSIIVSHKLSRHLMDGVIPLIRNVLL